MGLTAAILAGGCGTRLRSVVADRPKVLAPVYGRPYLTYLLDHLADAGVKQVVLLTGYLADQVKCALGEGHRGMRLVHSPEPEPFGTGGALRFGLPHLNGPRVLVLNGDSWCDFDIEEFYEFHRSRCAAMSLILSHRPEARRYGLVQFDNEGRVMQFAEKAGHGAGWINAGVYLLERRLIEEIPEGKSLSLEHELLPSWLGRGERIYAMCCQGRFLDIGTPESYARAENALAVRM